MSKSRIRRIGDPAPCTADYALLALVVALAVVLFAAMAGVELVRAVLWWR